MIPWNYTIHRASGACLFPIIYLHLDHVDQGELLWLKSPCYSL